MSEAIVTIEMKIHARTERGVLVSADEDKASAVWLPLAQVEIVEKSKGMVEIDMPEWLAEDRGLV